jgi:hypothetical protein
VSVLKRADVRLAAIYVADAGEASVEFQRVAAVTVS